MPIVSDKSKLSKIRKMSQGNSSGGGEGSRGGKGTSGGGTNQPKTSTAKITKNKFRDMSTPGGLVDKLGELRPVVMNPVKSSPSPSPTTTQRNSSRNRNDRNAQLSNKELQAISVAASRTLAREKEVAQLRQSQNTPLINIYNASPQEKGPVIPNLQTVNFFQNTNAKGFTKFKQPKETDFIQGNKSIDNDTTFLQSQPQQFLDIRGNKAIEFTQTNRAPINNENSRLLSLHQKDNFLDNYYGQLKGSGQLGIRRQSGPASLSLLKQPFIVRDIGNNWGLDTFDPSKVNGLNLGAVGQLLTLGLNVLDQLGGAVLGRQPSVFATRALSDLGRQGSFLLSAKGIGFLLKQKTLKRENKAYGIDKNGNTFLHGELTSPFGSLIGKYKGSVYGPISGFYRDNDGNQLIGNLTDIGVNLQKYSPKSLLSQPGIPSLQFSINKDKDAILAVQYAAGQTKDKIENLLNSIPNSVSDVFGDKLKNIPRYNIETDSKLNFNTDALLDKLTPVGDFVAGVAEQAQDLAKQGLNYLKGIKGPKFLSKFKSPFKTPKLPKFNNPFNFDGGGGGGINLGIPESLKGVGDFLSGTAKAIGSFSLNRVPVTAAKNLAAEIDLEAFAEVGVDKVNLIPYGTRNVNPNLKVAEGRNTGEAVTADGKTENELDFIPFRFEDSGGNIIVFRAILSGITDTFTPEYSSERYVGRPDNVYVYQGTTREISFTVDIYPKSAQELPVLWEKMNRLAGLTYPEWAAASGGNGLGMVAPFCKLTIGQMYTNTSGYISGLTFTVMDSSTWETMFAKLPKYIQASVSFVYVGDRMPSKDQKHFELPWVGGEGYDVNSKITTYSSIERQNKDTGLKRTFGQIQDTSKLSKSQINKTLGFG